MCTLRLNLATNLLDRAHDVRIGPTAADVPAHGFLDIVVAVTVRLVEKRDGRHDLPRRAVPALEAVVFNEGCLHRMERARLADAFNSRDCLSLMGGGQTQARVHSPAIDMDRTRAALA